MKKYILGLGLMLSMFLVSCGDDQIFDDDAQLETDIILIEDFLDANGLVADTLLPSEIRIIIDDPGEDPKADFGSSVETHYTGYLLDGTEFDSSFKRGEPISFPLNGVIKGWTEGLQLMKEGGKTTFYIPQDLAYGARPAPGGAIPPYAALIFDVELIKVNPKD